MPEYAPMKYTRTHIIPNVYMCVCVFYTLMYSYNIHLHNGKSLFRWHFNGYGFTIVVSPGWDAAWAPDRPLRSRACWPRTLRPVCQSCVRTGWTTPPLPTDRDLQINGFRWTAEFLYFLYTPSGTNTAATWRVKKLRHVYPNEYSREKNI